MIILYVNYMVSFQRTFNSYIKNENVGVKIRIFS